MKWFLILIATSFLLIPGSYFWVEFRLAELDQTARQHAPGQFVTLPAGKLHIQWNGPEKGPVVVLVHGFSTPGFIFEQNVAALNAAGFRTLRYDHFGRGWSDRPKLDYSVDFYDQTLLGLLDNQSIDEPVALIGLSMGGPIVAEFAARHPERVKHITLLVPAGLDLASTSGIAAQLFRAPAAGDWLWRMLGRALILGDDQYEEAQLAAENRLAGDVRAQMAYRGYFSALLSTLRHTPMTGREDTYHRLSQTGIPTLAIYGDADTTVQVSSAQKLSKCIPKADIRIIDAGTHGLNYQRHAEINPILVSALRSHFESYAEDAQ